MNQNANFFSSREAFFILMPTYIALLYSIQIANGKRLVMDDLKKWATGLGFDNPRTVLATGNLIFDTQDKDIPALESRLETAYQKRFGRHVPIIIRSAEKWPALLEANPFRDETKSDPSHVLVRVQREPVTADIIRILAPYCKDKEVIKVVRGDLWMYFPASIGKSKLASAVTIKRAGIGTSRNWNTLQRIAALL